MTGHLVLKHLLADKCVCPYATKAAREQAICWIEVPAHPKKRQEPLYRGLQDFWDGRPICILLLPESVSHKKDRALVWDVYCELAVALGRWDDPSDPVEEIREQVNRIIRPSLADTAPHQPFLPVRKQPVVTIAMGPQYSPDHPRYAPSLIMAMTRMSDIREVQQNPSAIQLIRERMRKLVGGLYDANLIYLAERPTLTEP